MIRSLDDLAARARQEEIPHHSVSGEVIDRIYRLPPSPEQPLLVVAALSLALSVVAVLASVVLTGQTSDPLVSLYQLASELTPWQLS